MIKRLLKSFVYLSMILFLSTSVFSAIEVFSTYNTNLKINSDETIDVSKHIELQNIHVVGIVPGRIEFKIGKVVEGSVSNMEVSNISVIDRHGQPIKYQLFETPENTVIAVDIFLPLLPGFKYVIDLDYTVSYESSGLLFKNLQFPILEDTSIDVIEGKFDLEIPEGYSFTFLDIGGQEVDLNKSKASWSVNKNSPSFGIVEYSYVPIKIGDLKGSYVFWILINIVLLLILAFEISRGIKKLKKGKH